MADIDNDKLVMKRRTKKQDTLEQSTPEVQKNKVTITDEDDDPQAKITELLNNPEKFKEMMATMNMDGDRMKNVMRDVTSNPETMKAARQMMGASNDEDLRNKLRQSMAKDGKQPTMKELRRKQKEYKKIMNSGKKESDKEDLRPKINCVKIDRNRNINFYKVKSDNDGKLNVPKTSQPGFERVGSLGVFYDPTKVNCENRVIKRIFGRNFGQEVTIYSLESKDLVCDERLLKELAQTKITVVDEGLEKLAEELKDI